MLRQGDLASELVCFKGRWRMPCQNGQVKCHGFCLDVCCDHETEDTCFDEDLNMFCASLSDGGCPCGNGEVRCGSFCIDADTACCCDRDKEEYCVDWEGTAKGDSYCHVYDDGGCPCGAGESRCGADESTIGYCSSICCEGDEPNLCIGEGFKMYCAAAECALNDRFDRNQQKMIGVTRSYGFAEEQDIIFKLLRLHREAGDAEKRRLEVEAASLAHTIESRRAHAKKGFQPRNYELSYM